MYLVLISFNLIFIITDDNVIFKTVILPFRDIKNP